MADISVEEYKRSINGSGLSTVMAAYYAQRVSDDPELRAKAKDLIKLEDEFEAMLDDRDITR